MINSGHTTCRLAPFFIVLVKTASFCTKTNCFGQNTSFHLNETTCFNNLRVLIMDLTKTQLSPLCFDFF
jgi:hypothetical protein